MLREPDLIGVRVISILPAFSGTTCSTNALHDGDRAHKHVKRLANVERARKAL